MENYRIKPFSNVRNSTYTEIVKSIDLETNGTIYIETLELIYNSTFDATYRSICVDLDRRDRILWTTNFIDQFNRRPHTYSSLPLHYNTDNEIRMDIILILLDNFRNMEMDKIKSDLIIIE